MARVATLLDKDFEDSEFRVPYDRLREAGHQVDVLGIKPGVVKGKQGKEEIRIETAVKDRSPDDYHALLIPGGYSPDHLRVDGDVVDFVRRFWASGKPVAAVCHGPQLLIEADVVKAHKVTSWPSIKCDLENAGATWVDSEVVVDGALITSRKPDDLEAFSKKLIEQIEASGSEKEET
jgi:protease I